MSAARSLFVVGVAASIGALLIRLATEHRYAVRRTPPSADKNFTDLNEADPEELQKLGLDSVAIDRIIENRPYRNKLELVSRMIIPEVLYKEIRHSIGVRRLRSRLPVPQRVA